VEFFTKKVLSIPCPVTVEFVVLRMIIVDNKLYTPIPQKGNMNLAVLTFAVDFWQLSKVHFQ
jgi:hypothetical protein